jgi:hypothetical protein
MAWGVGANFRTLASPTLPTRFCRLDSRPEGFYIPCAGGPQTPICMTLRPLSGCQFSNRVHFRVKPRPIEYELNAD